MNCFSSCSLTADVRVKVLWYEGGINTPSTHPPIKSVFYSWLSVLARGKSYSDIPRQMNHLYICIWCLVSVIPGHLSKKNVALQYRRDSFIRRTRLRLFRAIPIYSWPFPRILGHSNRSKWAFSSLVFSISNKNVVSLIIWV
jgi:hypothetical protein